jgi:hypothetical protein
MAVDWERETAGSRVGARVAARREEGNTGTRGRAPTGGTGPRSTRPSADESWLLAVLKESEDPGVEKRPEGGERSSSETVGAEVADAMAAEVAGGSEDKAGARVDVASRKEAGAAKGGGALPVTSG